MSGIDDLFARNRAWAERMEFERPGFFGQLAEQQFPEFLWIGCSDSRVPANQIVDLLPGQVFVHRNVANVVVHTDLNCLSVIQFAVDVLKVKHVIVCGHYGCGGVAGAIDSEKHGLIDNWLRHIQDIRQKHEPLFAARPTEHHRDMLCELNVIEQALNVCQTTVIQDAWTRGEIISVHGWIYRLHDGRLRNMQVTVSNREEIASVGTRALEQFRKRHDLS